MDESFDIRLRKVFISQKQTKYNEQFDKFDYINENHLYVN